MHQARLYTGQTKSGGFKAFVLGRTEKFGNLRMITVDEQPHRGFPTREVAANHARARIPTRAALAELARLSSNGQFISQGRQQDMLMQEVELPEGATPTGPTMPLADRVPAPRALTGASRPEPDSEERIVSDVTRHLVEDPSLAGRLEASVEMVSRSKQLRRTREAELAHQRQLEAADAESEIAIRRFTNAGELLIQYLRHTKRIATLEAERTTLWGALLLEFGTPERTQAMLEQARGVAQAWEERAAPATPPA